MRKLGLVAEFNYYAICTHPNAGRRSGIPPEVLDFTPLRAEISELGIQRIRQRATADRSKKITGPYESSSNPSLIKYFNSACNGTNRRWRLDNVIITVDHIILQYTDVKSKDQRTGEYSSEQIVIDYPFSFEVMVDRLDSPVPDRYEIYFRKYNEIKLSIAEYRNDEPYQHTLVEQGEGGKYYAKYSLYA